MPRAKKPTAEQSAVVQEAQTNAVLAMAEVIGSDDTTDTQKLLATIAATQLNVALHDSNDVIDLRIDRALFIAGKLLSKAKEVK